MHKTFIVLGSLNMFAAVALGAFGAHGLKGKLSPYFLEIYQTGVQYQMVHALGLLLVAALSTKLSPTLTNLSGWFLFAGIVIFSGSLYALSMSGIRTFGAITPIGGVSFLIGWLLLAYAAIKS